MKSYVLRKRDFSEVPRTPFDDIAVGGRVVYVLIPVGRNDMVCLLDTAEVMSLRLLDLRNQRLPSYGEFYVEIAGEGKVFTSEKFDELFEPYGREAEIAPKSQDLLHENYKNLSQSSVRYTVVREDRSELGTAG